jgi:hypothetical protein
LYNENRGRIVTRKLIEDDGVIEMTKVIVNWFQDLRRYQNLNTKRDPEINLPDDKAGSG